MSDDDLIQGLRCGVSDALKEAGHDDLAELVGVAIRRIRNSDPWPELQFDRSWLSVGLFRTPAATYMMPFAASAASSRAAVDTEPQGNDGPG